MQKIKLAEALLRRKELNDKVAQLRAVKDEKMFRMVVRRVKVSDDLDEVQAGVPRITMGQVTANYDHYARALRLIDAQIQKANWTVDVEVDDSVMDDFVEPPELKEEVIEVVHAR